MTMRRDRRHWLPRLNLVSRIAFLLLTPVLFRILNIAFIWHSIYWGAVTLVVLIWTGAILIAPLLGRIGCGWLCFVGTIQDFASETSLFRIGWRKPLRWVQFGWLVTFFATSLAFFFVRLHAGRIHGITFNPALFETGIPGHYKAVWLYDALGAVILGLLLERRWSCRNGCFMGALCAAGASVSRLLPVVDTDRCNYCGLCEEACPVRIPIREYVRDGHGLVTNAECLVCGKCIDPCRRDAVRVRFVWNRRKYAAARERATAPDATAPLRRTVAAARS